MMPALCTSVVEAFRPDGSLMDLALPLVEEVDFCAIAGTLSRIARFNGVPDGVGYPVSQHCVLGTEALLNEGEDELTAALFLLHDAHEHFIGDHTRPFMELLRAKLAARAGEKAGRELVGAIADIRQGWDEAIYAAAHLPPPTAWTNRQRSAVLAMDERMLLAESRSLFGSQAGQNIHVADRHRKARTPDFGARKNPLKPWGAMKAEEEFLKIFTRLRGQETLIRARALHAAHAATFTPNREG
ncbi:hypothetical protein [Rhizobium sp. SGZ-381]|uniref:hypothetical protein n=1 Tax=Rhizobium sp. SGZ-381 TaxID=3342800 RepID=UPI00367213A2